METYKHKLLFDYFGHIEEKEVDNFFTFSVRYYNKNSNRNLVKESDRVIVPLGVSEIHLTCDNGVDRIIYKWNGKLIDLTSEISTILSLQNKGVTLKMLFHAIKDNCDGMTTSMRLLDIELEYEYIVF